MPGQSREAPGVLSQSQLSGMPVVVHSLAKCSICFRTRLITSTSWSGIVVADQEVLDGAAKAGADRSAGDPVRLELAADLGDQIAGDPGQDLITHHRARRAVVGHCVVEGELAPVQRGSSSSPRRASGIPRAAWSMSTELWGKGLLRHR